MQYINIGIKLYKSLTANQSIIIATLERAMLNGYSTAEERKMYLHGMLSHIISRIAINQNLAKLRKLKHITPDFLPNIDNLVEITKPKKTHPRAGNLSPEEQEKVSEFIESC